LSTRNLLAEYVQNPTYVNSQGPQAKDWKSCPGRLRHICMATDSSESWPPAPPPRTQLIVETRSRPRTVGAGRGHSYVPVRGISAMIMMLIISS